MLKIHSNINKDPTWPLVFGKTKTNVSIIEAKLGNPKVSLIGDKIVEAFAEIRNLLLLKGDCNFFMVSAVRVPFRESIARKKASILAPFHQDIQRVDQIVSDNSSSGSLILSMSELDEAHLQELEAIKVPFIIVCGSLNLQQAALVIGQESLEIYNEIFSDNWPKIIDRFLAKFDMVSRLFVEHPEDEVWLQSFFKSSMELR